MVSSVLGASFLLLLVVIAEYRVHAENSQGDLAHGNERVSRFKQHATRE